MTARELTDPHASHEDVDIGDPVAVSHLQALVRLCAPPSVLVSRRGEILHVIGTIDPFVRLPTGRPDWSLLGLLKPALRADAKSLLDRAARETGRVEGTTRALEGVGRFRMVAQAVPSRGDESVLIAFEPVASDRIEPSSADGFPPATAEPPASELRELAGEAGDAALARDLRQALDEVDMFTHALSHDLRTSLRAMVGYSDVLALEFPGVLPPAGNEYLERIGKAGRRMTACLDELLKLAHLARGDLVVQDVDLTALIEDIGRAMERRHAGRRVEFHVAQGLRASGDPALLRVVFENLLDNAWKFSRMRDPARIEVGQTTRAGRPAVFVRDNGVGFDMSYRNRLFMPFQRLHDAEEFEGSGLGLATAKTIVTRHGGTLDGGARPGLGAFFFVSLPVP